MNDHASWNRACPTFLKKTEEVNSRNPENTLHFFPTTKSWTWTPSNQNSTPEPTTHYKHNQDPDQEHPQQNKNKGKGKAQARNIDTYIPNYAMDFEEIKNNLYKPEPGWDEDMEIAQPKYTSKPPRTTVTFVNNNRNAEAGPSNEPQNV